MLSAYLKEQGIGNAVYYPLPLHLQECFRYLSCTVGEFPESEKAANEVISLPIYPELTEEQKGKVGYSIGAFFLE